jgi:hypothetical protein
MLPPACSIAGGAAMIALAVGEPATLAVEDYGRLEELTSERFARDTRAAAAGWSAELIVEPASKAASDSKPDPELASNSDRVLVTVRLAAREPALLPEALHAGLQHAAHRAADREAVLVRGSGDAYHGYLTLVAGRYDVEISPLDGSWRLGGSLRSVPATLQLRAAGGGH